MIYNKKMLLVGMLAIIAAFPIGILIGRSEPFQTEEGFDGQDRDQKKSEKVLQKIKTRQKKNLKRAQQQNSDVALDSIFGDIDNDQLELLVRQSMESTDTPYGDSMLRVLTAQWAMNDPEAVLKFAASAGRSDLLEIALLEAAKSRGGDALDLLDAYVTDPDTRRYLASTVYRGIALRDPHEAVRLVEKLPEGNEREEALYNVMTEWVRQDVSAVFDWMEDAEVSPQMHNIYNSAMSQYIMNDPEQAADVIANMQACQLKTQLAVQAARQQAEGNVTKAIDWALSLDEEAQRQALFNVVEIWASGPNPEEALQYVTSNPDYSSYDELFEKTAINLAFSQPDQLLAAMGDLQEKDRIVAARQLANAFSATDPERCTELLDSLPEGNVRDAALKPAMDAFQYSDPSRAFDFSKQFSSDFKRLNSMETTLLEWAKMDYESALTALESSNVLNTKDKELLTQRFLNNSKPNDYILP